MESPIRFFDRFEGFLVIRVLVHRNDWFPHPLSVSCTYRLIINSEYQFVGTPDPISMFKSSAYCDFFDIYDHVLHRHPKSVAIE